MSVEPLLPDFMHNPITILTAQINTTVGAIEQNAKKIRNIITAYQNNHDIILFPELALCGYPPEDLLFRPDFHHRIQKALESITQCVQSCHVIIGHPELTPEGLYNTASLVFQRQIIAQYHKQQLPNEGIFDEKRYFKAGTSTPCLFKIKHQTIAVCICEDLWHADTIDHIITSKAELLLVMNASPYDYDKFDRRVQLIQQYTKQGLSIVYLNLIGGQDELVFDGRSIAMDHSNTIKTHLPAFTEACETITYDAGQLSGLMTPMPNRLETMYQALVLGLRDYIEKNHFSGVLLGLSGGIDSALTLAIAIDALGASRVEAVMMPSRYSASMSLEDAQTMLHTLGVKGMILPIEPIFSESLTTLEPAFVDQKPDVTEENLQARIRGMLLMAISNKTGKLVLSTSNKSESAVGYATLYGDMAGGFAPLKDVLKTQVYALAHYRNQISPVIPNRILTRAPSAELALNQTDQDTLPPYPVLDEILQAYIEKTWVPDALCHIDDAIVRDIIQRIHQNEYKRRQAAIGTKISSKAFGRDWRYPVTSSYFSQS